MFDTGRELREIVEERPGRRLRVPDRPLGVGRPHPDYLAVALAAVLIRRRTRTRRR